MRARCPWSLLCLLPFGAGCQATPQAPTSQAILADAGCIIEPRPKPGGTPGGGLVSAAGAHAPDGGEHYVLIDQAYASAAHEAVVFTFELESGDRLLLGPRHMQREDDYYTLEYAGGYEVTIRSQNSYLRASVVDPAGHTLLTRDQHDYLDIGASTGAYPAAPMRLARLRRLDKVEYRIGPTGSNNYKTEGAASVDFEAFGVPGSFTLISDLIHLRANWQEYEDHGEGMILRARPQANAYDSTEAHYDPIEYQITRDEKGYSILFDLHMHGSVIVAPLDDLTGGDRLLLPEGKARVVLSHAHRPVLQNRTVMVVEGHGIQKTFKTGSVVLREGGWSVQPTFKYLGKHAPTPETRDPEAWDVIAVQLDGIGTPTGFLIMGKDMKLKPEWIDELPQE